MRNRARSTTALGLTITLCSAALFSAAAQQIAATDRSANLAASLQCTGSQSCNLPPRSKEHRTPVNRFSSVEIDAFEQHDLTTDMGRRMLENEARSGFTATAEIDVEFSYASTKLTDEAKRTLDLLAAALNEPRLANHRFAVIGHTDAAGKNAANLRLSARRAQAVVDYLRSNGAVDGARLTAWGRGEEDLKRADKPDSLENRRIQIINAGLASDRAPSAPPAIAAPTTVFSNSAAGGPLPADAAPTAKGMPSTIEHGNGDHNECRRYLPAANSTVPCNF
jgi:outer membrane protein OmpA-like peptidoglycan-associated protein